MKRVLVCGVLSFTMLFTSCIGSFSAFNGLREWNEEITDNKIGNELIFLALWVVPVYQIATFADLIIFNSIEFWDGTNPIAMKDGESETKTIVSKGNTYEITASKNKFHVAIVKGDRKGESSDLVYLETDKSWNVKKDGELLKISSLKKGLLMVHLPNGDVLNIPQGLNRVAALDLLESNINEYDDCKYAELILE